MPARILLDNFEGRTTVAPWTFYNGAEFPGASGSLSLGAGHTGQGAVLSYNITCTNPDNTNTCAHYVSATKKLSQVIPLSANYALEFWVNAPPTMPVKVRLEDTSGQTFQFTASQALENLGANTWHRASITFASPDTHWGGANDGLFHGNLVSVTMMAADPLIYPTSGVLSFDDVVLVTDMPTFVLDPTQMKLLPAPVTAGKLAARWGVQIHFTQDNRALDIAKAAGFTFVRMDLAWADIEQNGQYNFSAYDGLLSALETRGMSALFEIDFGHPAHSPLTEFPWTPTRPQDIAAFARFAQAAATHFRGHNVRYEIWNEPNNIIFWKPTPNPSQYGALAKAAIAAVRLGDPQAQISTGGMGGPEVLAFMQKMFAAGGAQGANVIGVHPYRTNAPEYSAMDLLAVNTFANQKLGRAMAVWDTEWGYPSTWGFPSGTVDGHNANNRMRQAVWAARKTLTTWVLNLPVSVWYDLRDDGIDPFDQEHNFGLIDVQYNSKPALTVMQTLKTISQGRTYVGLLDQTPVGLHIMRINGASDTVFAAWQELPGRNTPISWSSQRQVTVLNMLGGTLKPICQASSCSVAVSENSGPVYLIFRPAVTVSAASAETVNVLEQSEGVASLQLFLPLAAR
ncbi:MAG: cellulase family glycosylhydrolase [Caldilineaceae bacterium]